MSSSSLSPRDRQAALALAQAIIPGSSRIPAADERVLQSAEEIVRGFSPHLVRPWLAAQRTLDLAAVASTGRRFSALDPDRRDALLRSWEKNPATRLPLTVVALVYKLLHFDLPHVYEAMGGCSEEATPACIEQPRWLEQIFKAADREDPEDVECDVVVVGTGAGGAVVGRELAERGHAVVFVEEGEHYRRDAFDGSSVSAHQRFYRAAASVGNIMMPVYVGRLVGGSTAVNGGTCFRTPSWVLDEWCERLGTDAFAPEKMERFFQRVEQLTEVAPAAQPQIGPVQGVFERGCRKLGWKLSVIRRNVVGCTASGFCDFGCRTDARRSTNLSYVPPALQHGAVLFTGLTADRVLVEGGRAVGVEGVAKNGRRMRVRARKVVLSGGAIPTPVLLQRQGLCNRSGQVGRNLALQASAGVSAQFDDSIAGWRHIPQGVFCDQFLRDGEMIIGALADVNMAAQLFPFVGRRLMDALDQLEHIASVGLLIRDARCDGRVLFETGGRVAIHYSMGREDRDRLHSCMVHAAELMAASGARRIFTSRFSLPEVSPDDLDTLRRSVPSASDIGAVSYHPMGTCRMGKNPRDSVVGLDHQTHDVKGLYVVDGSTIPTALGVNPQLTIMAMATRAAELIDAAL